MAIQDSGIENLDEESKLKVGVSVGSGIGGLETIYDGSITIVDTQSGGSTGNAKVILRVVT